MPDSIEQIVNTSEPLVDRAEVLTVDFAMKIFEKVEGYSIYKNFASHLGSDKTMLYFQACIKKEIKPYVLKMLDCKVGSLKVNKKSIRIPSTGIFALLKDSCPSDEFHINNSLVNRIFYCLFDLLMGFLRKVKIKVVNTWNQYWCCHNLNKFSETKPKIAVHYCEGIDFKRRNDINWFPKSGIGKDRLLIYLDYHGLQKKYGFLYSIPEQIVTNLKELGIEWILIPRGLMVAKQQKMWLPKEGNRLKWKINSEWKRTNQIEKWIIRTAKKLMEEVHFWKSFFITFNVKLLFLPDEGVPTIIAQGVAFDLLEKKAGIVIGKQRSDLSSAPKAFATCYTKDIIFIWNKRGTEYLELPYNKVNSAIISGHQNDNIFFQSNTEMENVRKKLIESGVKFIIALFDTGHGNPLERNFSTSDMEVFYGRFLNWVLEDSSIGLVIKSKKPYILETLPNIQTVLVEAESTGRCIRLANEFGRLPSDASRIAHMAVGASTSSAVTEAVILGSKGIHYCDKFPQRHEYYIWGYEKLVFTDIDRMVDALKRYKDNPDSNPELGDWTSYLDLLDPFRDGCASERMGTYIRWCLDGFDVGLNREDVIKQANRKYVATWGDDKVIKFVGSENCRN